MKPPKPTPPHVFDAMAIVARHLKSAGHVGVYVGEKGGAIFYRDCPLAHKREMYEEIRETHEEAKRLRAEVRRLRAALAKEAEAKQ